MLQAIIAAVGVGLILLMSELAWRVFKVRGELARKLVHIVAGTYIAFLPFWVGYGWIALLGIAFIAGNIFNRYTKVFSSIHAVKRLSWGDLFLGLAVTLCALLRPSEWVFMAAILQVSLADGLAAVAGVSVFKLRGRYTILNHTKTIGGTIVFWVISALIIAVTLALDPAVAAPMSHWPLVIMLAFLLTAIENVGLYGADNLLLPLAVVCILGSL